MSAASPDPAAPRPKVVPPPLRARAPRPPVTRLRRGMVMAVVLAAAGLLAFAFAWAFVVQPQLRAQQKLKAPNDPQGPVRASELVTTQPATYGQLPPPRRLGGDAQEPATPAPSSAARSAAAAPRSGPTAQAAGGGAAEARGSSLFFAGGSGSGQAIAVQARPDAGAGRDYAATYNTHALLAPLSPFELKAGAVVPAVLVTGVDTARAGPVVATVSDNVYDTVSGRTLVVPQGARLIGRHEGESRYGDKRAFLAWDRLILPNGKSLILTQEPGVDAQGMIGAEGRVDRRLGALAVATLFAGAISTLGEAARDRDDKGGGWLGDAGDAASVEAAQVGGRLIDRELQVRPTLRLAPGARVRVLITRDLVLEPYRP